MFARLNNVNPLARCFHKQRPPIGIDFGAYSVKAVQLAGSQGKWSLQAAAEAPTPDVPPKDRAEYVNAMTSTVKQLLASASFSGREVVTALPASQVVYKNLRLPPMPYQDLAKAVEWEASDRLELGVKGSLIQFFDAGEVRQGTDLKQELIVMAVPPDVIDDHVTILSNCGLDPQVIDVAPSAIARAAQAAVTSDAAQVIVDVGYQSSKVLIAKHGRVLFYKQIDIGGQQFDAEVAQAANTSPSQASRARRQLNTGADAQASANENPAGIGGETVLSAVERTVGQLGREIGLCLRYYSVTFRGGRPETVYLIGGEARQPWLTAALTESAGVEFAPLNAFTGVDTSSNTALIGAGRGGEAAVCPWASAVGLSRRVAQPAKQKGAA